MPYATVVSGSTVGDRDRYGFERNIERPIPIERINDTTKKSNVLPPLPSTTIATTLPNIVSKEITGNGATIFNAIGSVANSTPAQVLSQVPTSVPTLSPKKYLPTTSTLQSPPPPPVTYIAPLNSTKKSIGVKRFKDMNYDDIQINLRVLTNLNEGEKIMIINDAHMQPDNRYFSGLFMRSWSGDSIETTLQFIDHLIEETKKHCDEVVSSINSSSSNTDKKQYSLNKLIDIQTLLKSSINGLNKLEKTYESNKLNVATIETQIATIRTFCDQDLKKVVAASYHSVSSE